MQGDNLVNEHNLENIAKTNIPLIRGGIGHAGYELITPEEVIIKPNHLVSVDTGIKILEMNSNYYFEIKPKSGHTFKGHIDTRAGIIDSDYRGNIIVGLYNFGNKEYVIPKGKSVAQGILHRYYRFDNGQYVARDDDYEHKGFGSTNM